VLTIDVETKVLKLKSTKSNHQFYTMTTTITTSKIFFFDIISPATTNCFSLVWSSLKDKQIIGADQFVLLIEKEMEQTKPVDC
jgi:hypothetical protein